MFIKICLPSPPMNFNRKILSSFLLIIFLTFIFVNSVLHTHHYHSIRANSVVCFDNNSSSEFDIKCKTTNTFHKAIHLLTELLHVHISLTKASNIVVNDIGFVFDVEQSANVSCGLSKKIENIICDFSYSDGNFASRYNLIFYSLSFRGPPFC